MKAVCTIVVVVASLTAAAGALASYGTAMYTDSRHGLAVEVPLGWRVLHRRLTPCVNPIERLALAGHGALVMLQESLDARRFIRRFDRRPRHFVLTGRPQPIACCAPTDRSGWFFGFRDRGRAFYVYVYLGATGTRGEALALLDSLRVFAPGARTDAPHT